jgi:hypothetical protein
MKNNALFEDDFATHQHIEPELKQNHTTCRISKCSPALVTVSQYSAYQTECLHSTPRLAKRAEPYLEHQDISFGGVDEKS